MLFFDEENSIVKKFKIFKTERRRLAVAVIGVAALCLFFIHSRIPPTTAQAESRTGVEKNEIMVVPLQLDRESYGLAMVDTTGQTLWIYEISNRGGPAYNRLKLVAARSWRYDRELEQYNTAEPKPEQVKALLEGLGQQKKLNREQQPSVDVNVPKADKADGNIGK